MERHFSPVISNDESERNSNVSSAYLTPETITDCVAECSQYMSPVERIPTSTTEYLQPVVTLTNKTGQNFQPIKCSFSPVISNSESKINSSISSTYLTPESKTDCVAESSQYMSSVERIPTSTSEYLQPVVTLTNKTGQNFQPMECSFLPEISNSEREMNISISSIYLTSESKTDCAAESSQYMSPVEQIPTRTSEYLQSSVLTLTNKTDQNFTVTDNNRYQLLEALAHQTGDYSIIFGVYNEPTESVYDEIIQNIETTETLTKLETVTNIPNNIYSQLASTSLDKNHHSVIRSIRLKVAKNCLLFHEHRFVK